MNHIKKICTLILLLNDATNIQTSVKQTPKTPAPQVVQQPAKIQAPVTPTHPQPTTRLAGAPAQTNGTVALSDHAFPMPYQTAQALTLYNPTAIVQVATQGPGQTQYTYHPISLTSSLPNATQMTAYIDFTNINQPVFKIVDNNNTILGTSSIASAVEQNTETRWTLIYTYPNTTGSKAVPSAVYYGNDKVPLTLINSTGNPTPLSINQLTRFSVNGAAIPNWNFSLNVTQQFNAKIISTGVSTGMDNQGPTVAVVFYQGEQIIAISDNFYLNNSWQLNYTNVIGVQNQSQSSTSPQYLPSDIVTLIIGQDAYFELVSVEIRHKNKNRHNITIPIPPTNHQDFTSEEQQTFLSNVTTCLTDPTTQTVKFNAATNANYVSNYDYRWQLVITTSNANNSFPLTGNHYLRYTTPNTDLTNQYTFVIKYWLNNQLLQQSIPGGQDFTITTPIYNPAQ